MSRTLTDYQLEMLESIPPWMHSDPDIQAAFTAMTNELELIQASVQDVMDTYFPQFSERFLYLWEASLGLTVNPTGLSTAERQARVLAYAWQRHDRVPGQTWVANVTALIGPAWTWKRYPDGGTPLHTITITFTGDPDSGDELLAALRQITPANTVLVLDYGTGFVIQQSHIQSQPL